MNKFLIGLAGVLIVTTYIAVGLYLIEPAHQPDPGTPVIDTPEQMEATLAIPEQPLLIDYSFSAVAPERVNTSSDFCRYRFNGSKDCLTFGSIALLELWHKEAHGEL